MKNYLAIGFALAMIAGCGNNQQQESADCDAGMTQDEPIGSC